MLVAIVECIFLRLICSINNAVARFETLTDDTVVVIILDLWDFDLWLLACICITNTMLRAINKYHTGCLDERIRVVATTCIMR